MPETAIAPGTIVRVNVNREVVEATYLGPSSRYDGYSEVVYQGRKLVRKLTAQAPEIVQERAQEPARASSKPNLDKDSGSVLSTIVEDEEFNINERFGFITEMVQMVASGTAKSLIVTGSGGLGKTYTVMRGLEELDLDENDDYVVIKGYSTARSLYCKLYEANGKVIVFDDCDSVLEDRTAMNLLKSALDSTARRMLSWLAGNGENIPSTFEFTGRIIFISNKPLDRIPQPMLSRALFVDVTMTTDEKIERIRAIIRKIKPELTHEQKIEVLELIVAYKNRIHDLNIRTFLKACEIRESGSPAWKRLATYVLLTQASER